MEEWKKSSGSRVGVVGLGSVGGALKHTLEYFYDVCGYDIKGDHVWDAVLHTDIVFVCVDTPGGSDGRLDCRNVNDVLARLNAGGYRNVVVIRSTLRVDFMEEASRGFPALRLVYSPEFIRERSRLQWTVNPDRLVLSGRPRDVREALRFFRWVEGAKVLVMDARSAEVAKLVHNAYIALKVSFTNEIERISIELGARPTDVLNVVAADRRVGSKEHLRPFMGPFGGKCVPKDLRELMHAADNALLLRAVHAVNELTKARARPRKRGRAKAHRPSAEPISIEGGPPGPLAAGTAERDGNGKDQGVP